MLNVHFRLIRFFEIFYIALLSTTINPSQLSFANRSRADSTLFASSQLISATRQSATILKRKHKTETRWILGASCPCFCFWYSALASLINSSLKWYSSSFRLCSACLESVLRCQTPYATPVPNAVHRKTYYN